jgi:hypothetical protein
MRVTGKIVGGYIFHKDLPDVKCIEVDLQVKWVTIDGYGIDDDKITIDLGEASRITIDGTRGWRLFAAAPSKYCMELVLTRPSAADTGAA